jgi:hypothetical protein
MAPGGFISGMIDEHVEVKELILASKIFTASALR